MRLLQSMVFIMVVGLTASCQSNLQTNHSKGHSTIKEEKAKMSQNALTQDEIKFIQSIKELVSSDDIITDYAELIKTAPTDNKGQFWFQCAEALNHMEAGMQLDMRENGRLHVAWGILDNLLQYNSGFSQIWAEKVNVLTYIHSGYSSRLHALANVSGYEEQKATDIERAQFVKNELLTTIDTAIQKFPENKDWFQYEKKMFLESSE